MSSDENPGDSEKMRKESDKYTTSIAPSEDKKEDKRDDVTQGRENFLNIYKEGGDDGESKNDDPDLANGIRFKREEEEDSGFEL